MLLRLVVVPPEEYLALRPQVQPNGLVVNVEALSDVCHEVIVVVAARAYLFLDTALSDGVSMRIFRGLLDLLVYVQVIVFLSFWVQGVQLKWKRILVFLSYQLLEIGVRGRWRLLYL